MNPAYEWFVNNVSVGTLTTIGLLDFQDKYEGGNVKIAFVKEAMTIELPQVNQYTSVDTIGPLLKHHPAVLITDGSEIVGIVSSEDLVC